VCLVHNCGRYRGQRSIVFPAVSNLREITIGTISKEIYLKLGSIVKTGFARLQFLLMFTVAADLIMGFTLSL